METFQPYCLGFNFVIIEIFLQQRLFAVFLATEVFLRYLRILPKT